MFTKNTTASSFTPSSVLQTLFILIALVLHALYITYHLHSTPSFSVPPPVPASLPPPTAHNAAAQPQPSIPTPLPQLFIYRRTKKTGSSAMLSALLPVLLPLGYQPFYYPSASMPIQVRSEFSSTSPRPLLILEHNYITKAFHPTRSAVIADTFRDGFAQITSYCRFVLHVKECDSQEMVKCLESANTKAQINYRWARRNSEDDDTYIDLPLSSDHPALSTTVLRAVVPNATLHLRRFNVKNSACEKSPMLAAVYANHYAALDRQVDTLRRRMLILAGYPTLYDKKRNDSVGTVRMLEEAEKMESKKYDFRQDDALNKPESAAKGDNGLSQAHVDLMDAYLMWTRDENGKLIVRKIRQR